MSKYYSKVHVQYRDGSKAEGKKVTLGFTGVFGGLTSPVYTDRNGTAIVSHDSTGKATVYVSGAGVGTINAPCETVVFI